MSNKSEKWLLPITWFLQLASLAEGVLVINFINRSLKVIILVSVAEILFAAIIWLLYFGFLAEAGVFILIGCIYGLRWLICRILVIPTWLFTKFLNLFRKKKKDPFWSAFEFEEPLDEPGVGARHHDLGALRRASDFDDVGLLTVALRGAQLKLKSNPDFAHPFFWAPFVISGAR